MKRIGLRENHCKAKGKRAGANISQTAALREKRLDDSCPRTNMVMRIKMTCDMIWFH